MADSCMLVWGPWSMAAIFYVLSSDGEVWDHNEEKGLAGKRLTEGGWRVGKVSRNIGQGGACNSRGEEKFIRKMRTLIACETSWLFALPLKNCMYPTFHNSSNAHFIGGSHGRSWSSAGCPGGHVVWWLALLWQLEQYLPPRVKVVILHVSFRDLIAIYFPLKVTDVNTSCINWSYKVGVKWFVAKRKTFYCCEMYVFFLAVFFKIPSKLACLIKLGNNWIWYSLHKITINQILQDDGEIVSYICN